MKKAIICLLWSGLILFVYQEAMAELFKWVDEKGITHISDCLPKYLKDNPNIITISDRRANFRPEGPAFADQDPQGKTHLNTKSSKTIWRDKNSKIQIYAGYDGAYWRELCISFPFGRIPFRDDEGNKDKGTVLQNR
jgi:hypothetical protein